jgi:hypothetical protein
MTKNECENWVSNRCQWLTSIIVATQEAEIRRIAVQSQPQIVRETLPQKTHHKKRAGRVAQCVGSEFKSQYHKKKKHQLSEYKEGGLCGAE